MVIRFDAIEYKFDDNESMFLERQLESVEAKLYEVKLKELKYRTFIPVTNKDNPGASSIVYYMYSKTGLAKILASYSDDLPRADIKADEFSSPVKTIATSFGYSTQDIRAGTMAGIDLDDKKAVAARRATREQENHIAWFGDKKSGLIGLLTHPNITETTLAADAVWANKDGQAIIKDIKYGISTIRKQSKGIHNADTLLLPIDQYDMLSMIPRSEHSDMTVLEFLKKEGNSFGLKNVDWLNELEGTLTPKGANPDGRTGLDGALFYEKDDENFEYRVPLELTAHPAQDRDLEFVIPCEARNGGITMRYPLAFHIIKGI